MNPDFWHSKWNSNQIGFHQNAGNPLLQKHLGALGLTKGARIFLPLCGKTGDIDWLLTQGFQVVGAELSQIAVEHLFERLNIRPDITTYDTLTKYTSEHLTVFVGDIFHLHATTMGAVDASYDRAAYVALPKEIRPKYAQHLLEITANAPQLLITFDYDASTVSGPPFAISNAELDQTYGADYKRTALEITHPAAGIKGVMPATETIWMLT